MKKTRSFYILIAGGFIFSACSKPYQEALPTVQMVSVVPYGQTDSVLVTGNVTSAGASPVDYVGFSYSKTPNFDLLSRQVLGNGQTGQFSTVLPAYHDSALYYECFAANQYGYRVSNVIKYTLPAAKPDTAPCSLDSNNIYFSGTWNPSYITASGGSTYGSFYAEADFGFSYVVDIYFNQVPINGKYTVLNTMDFIDNPGNKYAVNIIMDNSNSVTEGGYVYVAQNKNGSTTVSFCSLTVNISSVNYSLSGKFTFN